MSCFVQAQFKHHHHNNSNPNPPRPSSSSSSFSSSSSSLLSSSSTIIITMSNTPYEKLHAPRESLEIEASEGLLGFRPVPKPVKKRRTWWIWVVHALLVAANITASFFLIKTGFGGSRGLANHMQQCQREPSAPFEYQPLQDIISYKTEYYDGEIGKPTIYAGDGPEVQAAWDEITAPPGKVGIFKIQKDELDAMNLSSIPLADGSGYVVTIDVFHQLHCLDWVRKAVDEKDRSQPLWREHTDTSILTYKWLDGFGKPWPDFRSFHTCKDFDAIKKFASERWFDAREPGIAIHPKYGPVDWRHHTHGATYSTPRRPYKYIDTEGNKLEGY